jgi:hypothetical protein
VQRLGQRGPVAALGVDDALETAAASEYELVEALADHNAMVDKDVLVHGLLLWLQLRLQLLMVLRRGQRGRGEQRRGRRWLRLWLSLWLWLWQRGGRQRAQEAKAFGGVPVDDSGQA